MSSDRRRADGSCWVCLGHKADTWLSLKSGSRWAMCQSCAVAFPSNYSMAPMVVVPDAEAFFDE